MPQQGHITAGAFPGRARIRGGAFVGNTGGRCPANVLGASHFNVGPALFQYELAQFIGGLCYGPAKAGIITYCKIAGGSGIPEFFVVIDTVAAAIFDTYLHVVQMDHFMNHRSYDVFYWAVKGPCTYIQLVAVFITTPPSFADGHMTISAGSAHNGYYGLFQRVIKIFRVESPKNLL